MFTLRVSSDLVACSFLCMSTKKAANAATKFTPRTKFDAILTRCRGLCAARATVGAVPGLDADDLLRAALAFAVAAMDAYFRDKFLERLVPFVKKKGDVRVLAEALKKASVDLEAVLELLDNDRPHRTLRNKVADWLLEKPMHDLDQVDKLFAGFGLPGLTIDAAKKAGAAGLRDKVAKVVSRRHDIVHYGDYFTGKQQVQPVDVADVQKQLDQVVRLVTEAESIIDKATT